jgi:BirA family transcriptional regulator, biotin operon repressor / biotin---[acetyl-CoA-carboxylase] ligase
VTTRDEVLSALHAAGTVPLSGEALAAELGVSRVAVGKHVSALRELGYEIAAVPGSGYRLLSVPDLALPGEVVPLLHSGFWTALTGGGATGSTNDDARVAARVGAPEGSVFLASSQSTGKGRLGRSWVSPIGGVYLSAVLRPRVAAAEVSSLTLAVALGVAQGLEPLGASPRLKWPNDVLLGDGKLAGLLHEMSVESDAVEWVVAGVGVNVRRPPTGDAGLEGAAYLEDATGALRLAEVAAAVLDGIAETYERWQLGGFAELRADYEARFALVGEEVRVSDMLGEVRAEGEVLGVDDEGRLLVRGADDAVAAVVAGEVTLRR